MGENKFSCLGGASNNRDSFGVETARILDACRDRDCYENVRVFLTAAGEAMLAATGNIRVKSAKITAANITVDPVQFNCGFYTVLIRFYVHCKFEACVAGSGSQELNGIAVLDKRVVLFGGESNVKVFRSEPCGSFCAVPEPVCYAQNMPEAVVETVDPVVLGTAIVEECSCCSCCCRACDLPPSVSECLNGALSDNDGLYLTISLGMFSVIRLVRNGQLLVTASEYCIPDKECCSHDDEDPCGTFRKMPFPAAEFCPNTVAPSAVGLTRGRCCGNS